MASEIRPVLIAPAGALGDRPSSKAEERDVPKAPKNAPNSLLWRAVSWLPNTLCEMCKDSSVMGFMVEGLNVASNVCSRAGETGTVPYLNIPATPLYFAHTVTKVKKRLQLAMTAAKVSTADAVLHVFQAVDGFGGAIGTLAQSVYAGAQMASLTQYALMGLIFSFILPRFLLATSSLGMVAGMWSLLRNNYALNHFQDKKEKGVVEALAFLSGQRTKVQIEDAHSDVVAKGALKSKKEEAKATHFLSETYDTKKIEKFFASLDLKQHLEDIKIQLSENECLPKVETLIQLLLKSELSSAELLKEVLFVYESFESHTPPKGLEGFFEEMLGKKEALLKRSGEFLNMAEEEIRIELYNQAFSLFILALIITGSSMLLKNPSDPFIPSMLSISASTLSMAMILHDAFISERSKKEFEKFLESIK